MKGRIALGLALFAACGGSTPEPQVVAPPPPPKRPAGAFPFEVGEAIGYRLVDATGAELGRAHASFANPEEGRWQIVTRVERQIEGSRVGVEHAATFRKDLSPVRYKRLSSLTGRYELEFGDDTITIASEPEARVMTNRSVRVPVLADDDLMMLALAIADLRLEPGKSGVIDAFAPEDLSKEVWKVSATSAPDGKMIVELPGGKVTLDARGAIELAEIGGKRWVKQPDAGKPPEVRFSPPLGYKRQPGRYKDELVRVPVVGGTIVGELSVPDDRAVWPSGAAPLVIIVSDRGEHTALGVAGGVDYGTLELADRLADRGIAVFRFDDRGVGASSSEVPQSDRGLAIWLGDLAAIAQELTKRPTIDKARVFLLGHGTGGLIALHAASRLELAGLLLVATPYRNVRDLLAGDEVRASRVDRIEAERRARNLLAALSGDIAALASVDPERLRQARSERSLYVDLAKAEVSALLPSIKVPVALFAGLKDFEVSWREDVDPMLKAMERALGKGRVKLHAYDHTDHLMKAEPRASTIERYADPSRRLETRYVEDLIAWVTAEAKRPKSP